MLDAIPRNFRNQLLSGLSEAQLGALAEHLEPVELPVKMVLEVPGEPIEHVYFPASGITSIVAISRDGKRVEAGLFGRDGMTGPVVLLGADRSPHETFVQVAGSGHRIEVAALREAMAAEPGIRDRFLLFVHASALQVAQTALVNAKNTIEARLARWLLMCLDRTNGDELVLTHEFLSLMLGVRRSGVTVSVHILEGRGLIRATRGRIRVLDRGALEAAADGGYGIPEAEYQRLLGQRAGEA